MKVRDRYIGGFMNTIKQQVLELQRVRHALQQHGIQYSSLYVYEKDLVAKLDADQQIRDQAIRDVASVMVE